MPPKTYWCNWQAEPSKGREGRKWNVYDSVMHGTNLVCQADRVELDVPSALVKTQPKLGHLQAHGTLTLQHQDGCTIARIK